LYAESSAVLAWLLGEPSQQSIIDELTDANRVVTSTLTAIECGRALSRARQLRRITATEELAALQILDEAIASWNVLDIIDAVAQRARDAFPNEPVRTLDAVHLATALVFLQSVGAVRVLTLDDRVRSNARGLGMAPVPV
jgi:uncharacterized protein with PIN domain